MNRTTGFALSAAALAAVIMTGCSGGVKIPVEPLATSSDPSISTPPTPSTVAAPHIIGIGQQATITRSSDDAGIYAGQFGITPTKILAVVPNPDIDGTMYYKVGVQIRVEPISGSPELSPYDFALSPSDWSVEDDGATHPDQRGASDDDTDATIKAACANIPQIHTAAEAAGATNDLTLGDILLDTSVTPFSGCVSFQYQGTPTTLELSDGTADANVLGIWNLVLPNPKPTPKAAPTHTPESGIVYAVTSEGGINSVTYGTSGFQQQQDTDVPGNDWSVKIPDAGVSIATVVAQNSGAGTITCTITVDGAVKTTQSSHGSYSVVTCSTPV